MLGQPTPNPPRHPAWGDKRPEGETPFTKAWEKDYANRWVLHRGYYYPIGTVIGEMEGPRGRYRRRW